MISALHGGCVVPTRGVPPPYTEGLTSLHGKTGFAARRDASPHHFNYEGRTRRGLSPKNPYSRFPLIVGN